MGILIYLLQIFCICNFDISIYNRTKYTVYESVNIHRLLGKVPENCLKSNHTHFVRIIICLFHHAKIYINKWSVL